MSKKVCLLGDFAVGKTSLVRRFVYDRFDDKYISTIGVKVSRKTLLISNSDRDDVSLSIMLWDLASSEGFDQVRASYIRGAAGAVLVCDLTRRQTLDGLSVYISELFRFNPQAQLVLAANKDDLVDKQQVTLADLEQSSAGMNARFFTTSAKSGSNVEDMFYHLGQLLVA